MGEAPENMHPGMRKVRDHLAGLDLALFDMRTWGGHDCGTPACISGWATRLIGPALGLQERGAQLGLNFTVAISLFFPDGHFLHDERDARDATAADAVRVLDHYARTGVVDWSV